MSLSPSVDRHGEVLPPPLQTCPAGKQILESVCKRKEACCSSLTVLG